MFVRRVLSAGVLASCSCFANASTASVAWLSADPSPVTTLDVAFASAPGRTTTWSRLHRPPSSVPIYVIVPLPHGASLDLVSTSWFDGLYDATAVRLVPGADGVCPGASPNDYANEIVGGAPRDAALGPTTVTFLADAAAVEAFASGVAVPLDLGVALALAATGAASFVAVEYPASSEASATQPLRVVTPSAPPVLDLSLAHADGDAIVVNAWLFGVAAGSLSPTRSVSVAASDLVWSPSEGRTNYAALRAAALASAPDAAITESSSHRAIADAVELEEVGDLDFWPVTSDYFLEDYYTWDSGIDAPRCLGTAARAFATSRPLGPSCPRGGIAVAADALPCDLGSSTGDVPAEAVSCGADDDLAVGLAGLYPRDAWLTRVSTSIPAGSDGAALDVSFAQGDPIDGPIWVTGLDTSGCPPIEDTASTTSSCAVSSSSSPAPSSVAAIAMLLAAALVALCRARLSSAAR